jgi:outer membrane scaffolding protein for murein synthesis (MipA/OmpV family)
MLKTIARLPAAAVALAGVLALPACHAETRPLWEVGAGLSVLSMPDYRGSDVTSAHVLPIPYLVYRGEILKADQDGLRGLLYNIERLEINISLNGTLPAIDDDNPARQGMDELKPTVEVGPTANFHLWRSTDRKTKLDLRLPVRTAITVESDPRQIGWLFSPNLILEVKDPAGFTGWNLGLQGGPYFNEGEYNAYFYSVSPAEATAERPAYAASGGYSGSQVTLTLTKRFPRYWVGGYVRYDNVSGAVYEDSPLFETQHAVAAGVAMSWIFGESARWVEVSE